MAHMGLGHVTRTNESNVVSGSHAIMLASRAARSRTSHGTGSRHTYG